MTTTTQAAGRVPGAAVGPPSPLPSPEVRPPAGGREIFPPATRRADLGPTRLKTSRTDGGPARAIAPVPSGEPEAQARARRFPPAAADRPHRFIPE